MYGANARKLMRHPRPSSSRCEAVQNLRKAVHSYKVQYEAAEKGSSKREKVGNLAFNYLYRCVHG